MSEHYNPYRLTGESEEDHVAFLREHESRWDDMKEPPEEKEESRFEQLPEKERQEWQAVIEKKLAHAKESGVEAAVYQQLEGYLQEIVARQNISPEAFDVLVSQVIIESEDRKASNGNYYRGAANPEAGTIHIFPKFFEIEEGTQFDPEHVIAHELGELAFRLTDDEEKPIFDHEEYQVFKAQPPFAMNGDYVDQATQPEHQFREEFAETFADFLRSGDAMEMFARRIQRYRHPEQIRDQLIGSPEGDAQRDYLLQESAFLRSFFQRALVDRKETLSERAINQPMFELPEIEFDSLASQGLVWDGPRLSTMAPRQPKEKKPKKLIPWLAEFLFG